MFNLNTQISYASANLSDSQTFEWESPRSFMYNIKAPLSLKSDFSYGDSFFSTSSSISYSPVWQEHPYISDDIDKIDASIRSSTYGPSKIPVASIPSRLGSFIFLHIHPNVMPTIKISAILNNIKLLLHSVSSPVNSAPYFCDIADFSVRNFDQQHPFVPLHAVNQASA